MESIYSHFIIVTENNVEMLAIGTSVGVYFKPLQGGRARPILSLRNVTQLGVMQKYQVLLVLAGNTEFCMICLADKQLTRDAC